MRPVLDLASMLAVGFFAAAVLAVAASDILPIARTGAGMAKIDYGSLGLGIMLGVVISGVARIAWSEIPARVVGYIASKRRTWRLIGWGVVFAAILLLY